MPYKKGQYVKARLEGWYGQVVEAEGLNSYKVRIGGTDRVKVLEEQYLEPQIVNNPLNLPLVKVVTNGGAKLIPQFDYAFTNEPGLRGTSGIWDEIGRIGLEPGAFVGVSGALLDFACKQRDSCRQIVSTDINILTVDAIDELRALSILLGRLNPAGTCNSVPCTRADLLTAVIDSCKTYPMTDPEKTIREHLFEPAQCWMAVASSLLRFAPRCYGKIICSSWFQDSASVPFLAEKIAANRFSVLCGDLQNTIFQNAINTALLERITLFNFSNVLDYVTNPIAIADFFSTLPHTGNAVVVTSSQNKRLQEALGTFSKAKVIPWADFIEILRSEKHQKNFGRLLE